MRESCANDPFQGIDAPGRRFEMQLLTIRALENHNTARLGNLRDCRHESHGFLALAALGMGG
jgi:hypothetical protein